MTQRLSSGWKLTFRTPRMTFAGQIGLPRRRRPIHDTKYFAVFSAVSSHVIARSALRPRGPHDHLPPQTAAGKSLPPAQTSSCCALSERWRPLECFAPCRVEVRVLVPRFHSVRCIPFFLLYLLGHCFGLIPAPGNFAASAFPVPAFHSLGSLPEGSPSLWEHKPSLFCAPSIWRRKKEKFTWT
jgi:hypothetical protein